MVMSSTEDDGEGGQPIGARVIAIGDQGRAVDLPADPDAEHGDDLIADKADKASQRQPAKVAYGLRVYQAMNGLVSGKDRTEQDDQDNQHSRQIFGAAEAIGEGL